MPKTPIPKAFSLVEILIVLAILAAIAAFALPKLLHNTNTQVEDSRQQSAVSSLDNAMQVAEGETGLPPMNLGPGSLLSKRLKAKTYNKMALADVPTACKTNPNVVSDNDNHAVLPDDTEIFGLSPKSWPDEFGNGLRGDYVCVVSGKSTKIVLIPRVGTIAQATSAAFTDDSTTTGTTSTDVDNDPDSPQPPITEIKNEFPVTVLVQSLFTDLPINGATVSDGSSNGTSSNDGQVIIKVPAGKTVTLTAQAFNYKDPNSSNTTVSKTITVNSPKNLTMILKFKYLFIPYANVRNMQQMALDKFHSGQMTQLQAILTYSYQPQLNATNLTKAHFNKLLNDPYWSALVKPEDRIKLQNSLAAHASQTFSGTIDQYNWDQHWLNDNAFPKCRQLRGATNGERLCYAD